MHAILPNDMVMEVTKMDEAYSAYHAAMAIAKKMLATDLITRKDYADIDTIMLQKYGISSCSIFRDMNLITPEV